MRNGTHPDSINARSPERATDTCAFLLTLTYIEVANSDITQFFERVGLAGICSSMRTARPAARSAHPFFEFRAHPFDMLPPCLLFLD